jgi:phosphatidylserine synthase
MPYYPLVLLLFGYLMVSSWRMPKFGKLKVRVLNRMTMACWLWATAWRCSSWRPSF